MPIEMQFVRNLRNIILNLEDIAAISKIDDNFIFLFFIAKRADENIEIGIKSLKPR